MERYIHNDKNTTIIPTTGDVMSRNRETFIVLLFIVFMAAAIISILFISYNSNTTNAVTPTEVPTSEYQTYIVREYDGMVAVFQPQQDKPIKITHTYVSSLPQADQKSLATGIQADTKEQLRKLLEDLCS